MNGTPLEQARVGMVLVHGRGASAADILNLAEVWQTSGMVYLAPQAAGSSWYPNRFVAPIDHNQPYLDSALETIGQAIEFFLAGGLPMEQIFLLGFSQGACLALEFAARHPQRYGGLFGLSGGLIGPPGTIWPTGGSLDNTPVFLGCSTTDPHIPAWRVQESAEVFARLGGQVTTRLYAGMGHSINQDELDFVQGVIERALDNIASI
ncbi:MAG: alpha/beta hydrolase [Anaerolineales bacterium]